MLGCGRECMGNRMRTMQIKNSPTPDHACSLYVHLMLRPPLKKQSTVPAAAQCRTTGKSYPVGRSIPWPGNSAPVGSPS